MVWSLPLGFRSEVAKHRFQFALEKKAITAENLHESRSLFSFFPRFAKKKEHPGF